MKKAILFAVLSVALVACCGCDIARAYAEELGKDPVNPLVPGDAAPTPSGDAAVDLLDILLWSMAAMGLGPLARVLGLARPLIAPLIRVIFRGKKADPKPADVPPATDK
jgi:hypothetical protein